jgi:S-adenosylmethionine:tRNA ribosyltransferase-isomerase
MKITDLQFDYPENLVAQQPQHPSRVMWVDAAKTAPEEISFADFIQKIPAGDLLVINNTKVLKRRVFAGEVEILFLGEYSQQEWEVLFPAKKFKVGETLELPEGIQLTLLEKGRPQKVKLDRRIDESYFQRVGELPLPPYIQKAREQRHTNDNDESWYQTAWATHPGSFAAPTASLHFGPESLQELRERGVHVAQLTLHVGLGTFLPVTAEDLNDHDMHEEYAEIPEGTWLQIKVARDQGKSIWALGTTAARTLESAANGMLIPKPDGSLSGFTKLLIQPGYQFKLVDRLITNFHQPESTLLALVAAFAGLEKTKACYQWAIERNFRLFSYGDLSCWMKPSQK